MNPKKAILTATRTTLQAEAETETAFLRMTVSEIYKSLRAWGMEVLSLPPGKVLRAWQDNQPLPEYPCCYFAITQIDRRSTNHTGFAINPATGKASGSQEALYAMTVQMDIYGPEATDLGQRAELMFRSARAVDFFSPYGLAPTHVSGPIMLTANRDPKGNWGERASLRLQFSFTNKITYDEDYFTEPVLEVQNSEIFDDKGEE